MRGIGNYRSVPTGAPTPQKERRAGQLLVYQGSRATVRLVDGHALAMPADPFRKLGLQAGDRFVLVSIYTGGQLTDVRIEKIAERRPAIAAKPLAKVMVRDSSNPLKVTTRR